MMQRFCVHVIGRGGVKPNIPRLVLAITVGEYTSFWAASDDGVLGGFGHRELMVCEDYNCQVEGCTRRAHLREPLRG